MKFFNSKKEIFLWFFFFLVTFGVGYFHGSQPEVKLSYHYTEPKTIDVIYLAGQPFQNEFLTYIEKETHTIIRPVAKKNYEELRTELIINKNAVLALIPENFVEPLYKDNRIKNLELIKDSIESEIHKDFTPKKHNDKIYSLPVSWFVNVFIVPTKDLSKNSFSILENGFLKQIKSLNPQWGYSEKSLIQIHNMDNTKIEAGFINELSIQQAEDLKINYQISPHWSQLLVYSLVVPNITPDRELSFKVLSLLLNDQVAKKSFLSHSLGYTWKTIDSKSLKLIHNPESLRNLKLKDFSTNYNKFDEKFWR